MLSLKFSKILLYGGISRDEFEQIRPMIWKRNSRILRITSIMSAIMGLLFFIYVLFTGSGTRLPYVVLTAGSLVIWALDLLAERLKAEPFSMLLCYGQMLLLCVYAGVLSTVNSAIPATSIVVFIALLPLTIDDRMIRMFSVMAAESAAYLALSFKYKEPASFSLDVMNVGTFCVIGMALYGVICTRNIREIYQGVRIERIQRSVISSMATVVEERDESTGGHIVRTEDYVRRLSAQMKKQEKYSALSDEFYSNVLLAAPMHDIGKIHISDAILNKPGRLTDEEFSVMKKHSEYGAEIIQKTMRDVEEESYFETACNIAKYHHERFDGTGYPDGLRGEDIPIEARMMALADVYDALISERVYKKPYSAEKARRIIEEGAGTQFDPDLAALFLKCVE